ncbi:hypothetical protein [uncultured Trichococcus sp.]|uniref:hypothetical protein n=1 Tax=uncultured Trichococcus sp. TaxID=189665 RepID=UPI0029C9643D|nr:hypothetical protein [uncultured Trichococcus sp.]
MSKNNPSVPAVRILLKSPNAKQSRLIHENWVRRDYASYGRKLALSDRPAFDRCVLLCVFQNGTLAQWLDFPVVALIIFVEGRNLFLP